ncbi:hypothetical protein [Streptomyces sp. RPT161]|uniref:hypothetical protein n=1 Tax=Streptomyces sp. RPT161 TaxID=3015993 RepID=UPI0022B912C8|nr:hypothetical protein [Streptomyces sp. RPT161]
MAELPYPRELFGHFVRTQCRGRSPLYTVLGEGIAEDEVLALADPYLSWLAPARRNGDDFGWAAAAGPHRTG